MSTAGHGSPWNRLEFNIVCGDTLRVWNSSSRRCGHDLILAKRNSRLPAAASTWKVKQIVKCLANGSKRPVRREGDLIRSRHEGLDLVLRRGASPAKPIWMKRKVEHS